MFDKVRIGSLLDRIENSILLIQSKSGEINCPDDFLLSQFVVIYILSYTSGGVTTHHDFRTICIEYVHTEIRFG